MSRAMWPCVFVCDLSRSFIRTLGEFETGAMGRTGSVLESIVLSKLVCITYGVCTSLPHRIRSARGGPTSESPRRKKHKPDRDVKRAYALASGGCKAST